MSLIKTILTEGLVISDTRNYAIAVTEAYKARPIKDDAEILQSWNILNKHNNLMFKRLSSKIEVIFTDEDNPYETAEDMKEKVLSSKKMYISKGFSDDLKSGWTPEDNWKFRAVHDYVVHIGGKVDFSQRGEIKAFVVHDKIAPPKALDALFSEIVGQACFVTVTGDFPSPQKACKLYGFDYDNVGNIDWMEYEKNFTQNQIRSYSEDKIKTIINKVKF